MIAGFKATNHPQQVARRGAIDEVDDRATPLDEFTAIADRFGGFTLDVAAAAHNTKCDRYFDRIEDGLAQPWTGRVWCNPPFSDLRAWVEKAWDEWSRNRELIGSNTIALGDTSPPPETIVMLVPANRAEQRWWQELVEPFRDRANSNLSVEFLPGRMRFERPDWIPSAKGDRPPFGCCLLIWKRP